MYSQTIVQPDYSRNFDGAVGRDGSDATQDLGGAACVMRVEVEERTRRRTERQSRSE